MSSIYDWSLTAANNGNSDSAINWQEGQFPSTVNNSARQMMTRQAEFLKDIGGTVTAGGTANAVTVLANSPFTAYATGQIVGFKGAAVNTGAATLNVNSIGAKAIRKVSAAADVALNGSEIITNGVYICIYDTALNSGAGGWLLLNPAYGLDAFASIASAATTDLSTVGSQNVTVTGTTTITSFGTAAAGTLRRVVFSGALILTYNATSLILPGAASITTTAGDVAEFVSLGSGNWRCVDYAQSARNPTFPVYLAVQNATATGTLDFSIPKSTTEITINFMGVSTNATGSVILQIGSGGTPETTGYLGSVASVSNALLFSSGTGFFDFTSDAAAVRHGKVVLTLADSSTNTWTVSYHLGLSDTANIRTGGGSKALSGELNIVRLTMSSGQFDAGKIGVVCR